MHPKTLLIPALFVVFVHTEAGAAGTCLLSRTGEGSLESSPIKPIQGGEPEGEDLERIPYPIMIIQGNRDAVVAIEDVLNVALDFTCGRRVLLAVIGEADRGLPSESTSVCASQAWAPKETGMGPPPGLKGIEGIHGVFQDS